MEKITDLCTGCRACEQVCAHHAVSFCEDEEGFLVPHIEAKLCVDCGLCQKRCPQNTGVVKYPAKDVYAARDKNDDEIYHSASGGVFAVAARHILLKGGYVVGAAYERNYEVSHILTNEMGDLPKLQSSKYVQSNTKDTYSKVKELLNAGIYVLYSGTPCQIGGLRAYLHKDYENLFTMEVICHGVPSPKLFQRYIRWTEKRLKGKLLFFDFRDKSYGWGLDYMTKTKTKTKTKTCVLDPYYIYFLHCKTYRECCYHCKYCTPSRVSDFTIGDYWGLEHEHPEFYSSKGVSCVLVNTEKGQSLWEAIKEEFEYIDSNFDRVARLNHNLRTPSPRPEIRDRVYKKLYTIEDDNEFFKTQLPIPYNLKARIKSMMPIAIKRFIKTRLLGRK